ncbi:hypothetical protein REJC140_00861 [Pseudorhizobium endolithicum]|uniref:DUF1902 domain-containing protein n=1 Tax=Pseudorhizobium endolithicum TaxID=1191678 RepID=A0ABN7JNW1_9HYPH|nr:DUF1902 domain-containing protein [Pseudorhizobium endolithicum]CAD6407822.1 hypothetical protein REQ54_00318 [Rhizobium sp. Q54]CAD7040296.1 hypothetical protein REJC140_00861 [Pseudorhizobium endolithicum]
MKHSSIIVRALWDEEAEVWVASSKDIDGLSVEAETFERLEKKVVLAIGDLLELNGQAFDLPEIPVHIMSEHLAKVPNPRY